VARLVAATLSADAFALYDRAARVFANHHGRTDRPDTLLPRRVTERRVLQLRVDPLLGDDGIDVNRQDEVTTACAWR
jgi:hypothetical protein